MIIFCVFSGWRDWIVRLLTNLQLENLSIVIGLKLQFKMIHWILRRKINHPKKWRVEFYFIFLSKFSYSRRKKFLILIISYIYKLIIFRIRFQLNYLYFLFPAGDVKATSPKPTIPREEPEKIKKWREEQRKRLEEKGYFQFYCSNIIENLS